MNIYNSCISLFRNKTFTIKDIEEDSSGQSSSTIIAPAPITSATPLRSHSATVIPWSSLLQGTPQTPGSDSGSSRPGSARKQWINEQVSFFEIVIYYNNTHNISHKNMFRNN